VHVCIIYVAIRRLGWTPMKAITSQHEVSFTAHGRTPSHMYLKPHADIGLSRRCPSFAAAYCQGLGSRNSKPMSNAVFLARLQVSWTTLKLHTSWDSAISRLSALRRQSAFFASAIRPIGKRNLGCFRGTPHCSSTQRPAHRLYGCLHVREKPFSTTMHCCCMSHAYKRLGIASAILR
jgi:hypothetical protein